MKRLFLIGVGATVAVAAGFFLIVGKGSAPEATPVVGAPLAEVRVPVLTGAALQGEALFNTNCAKCHGANAAGQNGVAPPLVHKIYEPNHHSDGAFYMAALRGARAHHWPFGDMPPVEGVSEQDVALILAYVRTLQRENGIF